MRAGAASPAPPETPRRNSASRTSFRVGLANKKALPRVELNSIFPCDPKLTHNSFGDNLTRKIIGCNHREIHLTCIYKFKSPFNARDGLAIVTIITCIYVFQYISSSTNTPSFGLSWSVKSSTIMPRFIILRTRVFDIFQMTYRLGYFWLRSLTNSRGKFLSLAPSAQSRKTNLGVLFWRVSGIDIPFPIMSIVAP